MPALTTNWIVLRNAFVEALVGELERGLQPQVNYDKGYVTRAASQMVVQVRRGNADGFEETFNQLVMSEKMRGRQVVEESLFSQMHGLVFGAMAGIAAVKSR